RRRPTRGTAAAGRRSRRAFGSARFGRRGLAARLRITLAAVELEPAARALPRPVPPLHRGAAPPATLGFAHGVERTDRSGRLRRRRFRAESADETSIATLSRTADGSTVPDAPSTERE